MHENADEVRRSRGVLLPFSQPQFLFRFIPPLLGCFHIQDSMLIIFSGRIRLLLSPACLNFFAISLPVLNDTTAVESLPLFSLLGHWHPRPPFDAKFYSASWRDRQTRRRICHFCRGMRIGGGESKSENAQ
jgi:hypothetical protein